MVSSSEFDSVAKDLGADTFEKRDKLREDLAKIANENEMTNTPPSNSANASDIEQEVCLEVLSEEGNKNMPKTIQEDICISEESPS